MKRSFDGNFILLGLLSFCVFVFYLFYINLSIDAILLFIAQKIFLGNTLLHGAIPFFNPLIYAGIPFLFDVGMGHLHPFNLFFLLPYPYSYALWISLTTLFFLTGFYILFLRLSKTKLFAFICVLILFFSGSGYWRVNNPTIYLVIAHFGFFLFFLSDLHRSTVSWRFVMMGVLLSLAGHVQFVMYGFILALLFGVKVEKISLKKILINFLLTSLIVLPYYVLSLPIVLNSTRITTDSSYTDMGKMPLLQLAQLVLPLFLGHVQNGSSWNVGYTFVILISPIFTFFILLLITNKQFFKNIIDFLILFLFLFAALGFFNFPFFRAPSQIILIFHIWGLVLITRNENAILKVASRLPLKRIGLTILTVSVFAFLFFFTELFSTTFLFIYEFIKKRPPNLFFDKATIGEIGNLFGLNFILYFVFGLLLIITPLLKNKYKIFHLLFVFAIFDGVFINYFHNYFIEQKYLIKKYNPVSSEIRSMYRIQTSSDVIPYSGFHNYMSNVLFRPPFSKEPSLINDQEEKNRDLFQNIMSLFPSTWGMVYGINAVQGYNTFVTKDIAEYFKKETPDYSEEYKAILERNSFFGQSEKGLAINGIETSKITLYDPRWEKLGVRYFISDRPLKKYKLIEHKNGRFIYENEWAPPIYRVVAGDNMTAKKPTYQNPNEWHFDISFTEKGSHFEMVMNPGGFAATLNDKPVEIQKSTFLLRVPLTHEGKLILRYSPVQHLKETLEAKL